MRAQHIGSRRLIRSTLLGLILLLALPTHAPAASGSDSVPPRFQYPRLGPPWPKPVHPSWVSKGVVFVGNWEPLQWAYRKNWQNWGKAATGKRAEEIHRQDRSEATLLRLKDMGVNMVLSSFHKGFGIENEKYNMDEAREWGTLLHKHGMRLGVLVSTLLIYEDLYHEFPEAKEWHRILFDGTPSTYGDDGYRYRAFLNHPAYIDYMKRVCELAVKAGADAIFFDTMNQPAENHHPLNERMFRDWLKQKYPDDRDWFFRTGLHYRDYVKVPHLVDPTIPTFDQAIVQEYIDFKSQLVVDFCAEFATFIHKLNPETAFWINGHGAMNGGNSAWQVSYDNGRLMPWLDMYYSEEADYADYSAEGGIISKIRTIKSGSRFGAIHTNAAGEPTPGDTLSQQRDNLRLRLAEAMAFNRASLGNMGYGATHVGSTFPEAGRQYIRFFWKSQSLLQGCESAADVAVLRSFASMSFNSYAPHRETILAEQALIQAQVPFDIVYDADLANLSKYKVLILADQESLSDTQVENIRGFVQRGGGLVATADMSAYDHWRRQREAPGLGDVLGLTGTGHHSSPVRHVFGKGRAAFMPGLIPAIPVPDRMATYRKYWAPPKNAAQFIEDVRWAASGKSAWEIVAPPYVAVEAYSQPARNRYILHLLNYNSKVQPAVNNIQVTVRARNAGAKLSVYSPDDSAAFTIKATPTAEGMNFTLPKLSTYSIIAIENQTK